MKPPSRHLRLTVLVFGLVSGVRAGIEGETVLRVSNLEGLRSAQRLVGPAAPDLGAPITIHLGPGAYHLDDTFHIARSRVSLIAEEGARLVLARGVKQPVVVIGTQVESQPGPFPEACFVPESCDSSSPAARRVALP